MSIKTSYLEAQKAVKELKKKYGNGISALLIFENKTGEFIEITNAYSEIGNWFDEKEPKNINIPPGYFLSALHVHPFASTQGSKGEIVLSTLVGQKAEQNSQYPVFYNNENRKKWKFSWDIPWFKLVVGENTYKCWNKEMQYTATKNLKETSPLLHITLLPQQYQEPKQQSPEYSFHNHPANINKNQNIQQQQVQQIQQIPPQISQQQYLEQYNNGVYNSNIIQNYNQQYQQNNLQQQQQQQQQQYQQQQSNQQPQFQNQQIPQQFNQNSQINLQPQQQYQQDQYQYPQNNSQQVQQYNFPQQLSQIQQNQQPVQQQESVKKDITSSQKKIEKSKIENNNLQQTEENECKICMSEKAEIACIPCGHRYCQTCIVDVQSQKSCFICRQEVRDVLKLY